MVFSCGLAPQRVHAVPGALRRRRGQVEQLPGAGLARSPTPTRSASAGASAPRSRAPRRSPVSSARCSSAASPRSPAVTTAGAGRTLLLGIPMIPLAIFAFRIPEPPRGQFEKLDVLGEVIEDTQPGADLDRGGVRPAAPDPHLPDDAAGVRRAWASGCSPGRCSRTSSWRTTSGSESFGRGVVGTVERPRRAAASLPFVGQALRRPVPPRPAEALRLLGAAHRPGRRSSCRSSTSCRTRCCSRPSACSRPCC